MKKIIIILYCSMVCCVFSMDAQFETDMEKANQLYEKNQFVEAYNIYERLVNEEHYSYQLFYNLASTFYQLDSVAPSIYYYEKAQLVKKGDADLEHNLSLAYGRQQDDIDKFPELFVVTFLKKIANIFATNLWLIISLLSLWAAAVLYYFQYTRKGFLFEGQRWPWLLVFGMMAFLMSYLNNYYNNSTEHAIVYQAETAVFKSANIDSENLLTIHEGLKLIVLDEVDEWMKVKMSDNTIGWLKKSGVRKL